MNFVDQIISILAFVRVEDGILEVRTRSGEWIPALDYGDNEQEFSVHLLSEIDYQLQLVRLCNFFYENFYVTGNDSFQPQKKVPTPKLLELSDIFLENRPARFDKAFYKTELTNGQGIFTNYTSQFAVTRGEWVKNGQVTGDLTIAELFSKEARTDALEDSNTWYVSDGMHHGFNAEDQLIRFYLNPYPLVSKQIAHYLIGQLDHYGIQFQIKYIEPNSKQDRCDRIVIYVPQRQFIIASWIVIQAYEKFENFWRPDVPLFVRKIYPGIGFAEETFTGESFGKSRCLWIASALQEWSLTLKPYSSASIDVKQVIDRILEEQKIKDLETVYLNPGSRYPYAFTVFDHVASFSGGRTDMNKYLTTAIEIGNFICREAVWGHLGKCKWVGTVASASRNPIYKVLGKDWERGILGPLLYLFVLQKYTHDPLYGYIVNSAESPLSELLKEHPLANALLGLYDHKPEKLAILGNLWENLLQKGLMKRNDQTLGMEKMGTPQLGVFEEIRQILLVGQESPDFNWARLYELLTQVRQQPNLFLTNEFGWDDFFPGMNGLSLLGFSYLLAYDPKLPQIPLGQL